MQHILILGSITKSCTREFVGGIPIVRSALRHNAWHCTSAAALLTCWFKQLYECKWSWQIYCISVYPMTESPCWYKILFSVARNRIHIFRLLEHQQLYKCSPNPNAFSGGPWDDNKGNERIGEQTVSWKFPPNTKAGLTTSSIKSGKQTFCHF